MEGYWIYSTITTNPQLSNICGWLTRKIVPLWQSTSLSPLLKAVHVQEEVGRALTVETYQKTCRETSQVTPAALNEITSDYDEKELTGRRKTTPCAGEMSLPLKDPKKKNPLLADRNVCVLLPDVGPATFWQRCYRVMAIFRYPPRPPV